MDCLVNRIGIRGCDAPASEAVAASAPGVIPIVLAVEALPILFINDLPGVSLAKIDSLTDDEMETYLDVWGTVVLRAIKKFEILVKAKLNQCYKLTDKTVVACLVCEKKDLFDVALWYLHGTELMIEITSTDEMNQYTTIGMEKAEKLKEEFYAEFQSALTDAVQSITPADSDCVPSCLECNDNVKWVMQAP
jgi:hypothetical protein